MFNDAVSNFIGEIQAGSVFLKNIDDPQALDIVVKPTGVNLSQYCLTSVSKGCMAEVMPQGDGLGEVFVEPEGARDGAGDLGYLEDVREARPVVVALWGKKYLSLVFQAPERLTVDYPVSVTLVAGAYIAFFLSGLAASGCDAQSGARV